MGLTTSALVIKESPIGGSLIYEIEAGEWSKGTVELLVTLWFWDEEETYSAEFETVVSTEAEETRGENSAKLGKMVDEVAKVTYSLMHVDPETDSE